MRKRTAAALLAAVAAALAYPPTRGLIGDTMIDAGIRLAYGEPPPYDRAKWRKGEAALIAAAREQERAARVGRNGRYDSPV